LSIETDDPDKILSKFDSISYDKGASVIRMMVNFIGTDTFSDGIRAYLEKYKYSNAAKVISYYIGHCCSMQKESFCKLGSPVLNAIDRFKWLTVVGLLTT